MADMSSSAHAWHAVLKRAQVIVVLGAGGVGKTTSSIAMALLAARQGRRVGLISIDPAKRLAAALGISLDGELKPITLPADVGSGGSIEAAMLDQKAVFDAMVRRHSPSAKIAEKILQNRLYQSASSNLGGALEYMALAKLQQMVDDGGYDLVVIDTPPDSHALDFLSRPNILANFFENKVMSWLIKPFFLAQKFGLGKVMSAGEKMMGGLASVTGVKALQMLSEFLLLMQEVLQGFNKSGERLSMILHDPATAFMLVSAPRSAARRSAENISSELIKRKFNLRFLIMNRCMPVEMADALLSAPVAFTAPGERVVAAYQKMSRGQQTLIAGMLKHIDQNHADVITLRSDEAASALGDLPSLYDFANRIESFGPSA